VRDVGDLGDAGVLWNDEADVLEYRGGRAEVAHSVQGLAAAEAGGVEERLVDDFADEGRVAAEQLRQARERAVAALVEVTQRAAGGVGRQHERRQGKLVPRGRIEGHGRRVDEQRLACDNDDLVEDFRAADAGARAREVADGFVGIRLEVEHRELEVRLARNAQNL